MAEEIRFGEFIREASTNQRAVSYNELTLDPEFDASGNEIPFQVPLLRSTRFELPELQEEA